MKEAVVFTAHWTPQENILRSEEKERVKKEWTDQFELYEKCK